MLDSEIQKMIDNICYSFKMIDNLQDVGVSSGLIEFHKLVIESEAKAILEFVKR